MTDRVDLTLNGVALSDAVPAAYVLNVARPLVGKRRHRTIEVPGRAGSWTFPEQPGDARIEIDLDLEASSFEDRRAAVRALADWADVGDLSNLTLSDEPDRYRVGILDTDSDVLERLLYGETTLVFLCYPYAYDNNESNETLNISGLPASGSFSIPDTVYAEPVIEITPTNGTLTGFTLTVNGLALTWAGLILSGETITISSLSDTVTLGANDDVDLLGAFDPDNIDMADVSGEFPLLYPGSNTWNMTRTGTATQITVVFTWRERYR